MAEARAAELSSLSLQQMDAAESAPAHTTTHAVAALPDHIEKDLQQEEEVAKLADNVARLATRDRSAPSQPQAQLPARPRTACLGCGGNHYRDACQFKDATCHQCGRKGHLARVCRARRNQYFNRERRNNSPARWTPETSSSKRRDCFSVVGQPRHSAPKRPTSSIHKITVTVGLGGVQCAMEVDTGSALSIMSWDTLKKIFPRISKSELEVCPVHLKDYQGGRIPVVGKGYFHVKFKNFSGKLPLIIVHAPLTSLLGLDWFQALGFQVTGVHSIAEGPCRERLVREFPEVFDGKLGKYKGPPISFKLDPQVRPIRLKPRRLPLALRPKVDRELDKLQAQGVIEPVEQAEWETPIVTPIKPDGTVRVCADYKCTINRALAPQSYPVPVVQHLLHSLGEGRYFARIDLTQAYQQLPVDAHAAEAQTIVMHRGAYRCNRLQFGVSIAPGLFQGLMERLLQGINGALPYFDDVLVVGLTEQELMDRLRAILTKFQTVGLKVNAAKCVFMATSVDFLGFKVDALGIHPTTEKTAAIVNAPRPRSKAELQAFLGLLNFYAVFLPHKASLAEPLHRLLDAGARWQWGRVHSQAFTAVKNLLVSNSVLAQYSEHLPLILACDASDYGVGAVLSHRLPDGKEAPIAFYSRTLAGPERNYSQIDKEALALMAGVRRFHYYLYGRPFTLVTDHQPLLGIFTREKQSPALMSPRMTRWTVFLANYDYMLTYKPGRHIAHADALSRCPLPIPLEDPAPAASVLAITELNLPISAPDIARETSKDPLLTRIKMWILRGWPQGTPPPEMGPFKNRQHELSVLDGCILWGDRVVIPKKLRDPMLSLLHQTHPGIVRMKALARSYLWWPGLDRAIEEKVASCTICQQSRAMPPQEEPQGWESPSSPWSRLHIDLAGPFKGQMFFIIVDAFSKWLEVRLMQSTTTEAIISSLCSVFATHGLPDLVISDNGPQFTSSQFQQFLRERGIRQGLVAPWHPQANGLAERMVRTTKETLAKLPGGSWQQKLNKLLLAQHTTPCVATNKSPAELLMGRRLRMVLDRIHPHYAGRSPLGSSGPYRAMALGTDVYARNYAGEPLWLPATVVKVLGPCSYRVMLQDGRTWHRHIDQLRTRQASAVQEKTLVPGEPPEPPTATLPDCPPAVQAPGPGEDALSPPGSTNLEGIGSGEELLSGPRRSGRIRRRPAYLNDYECTNLEEEGVLCPQLI